MSLESLCSTHVVTFERPTIEVDSSAGSRRDTWTAIMGLTDLPASIQSTTGKESMRFGQRQVLLSDVVYLAGKYDELIQRSDRMKEPSTGRLFRVLNTADVGGKGRMTMVEVQEFMP